MKLAILLTATIHPNVVGGNYTAEERMKMYASTLRFYKQTLGTSYPIVFVENSDCDIQPLKDEFDGCLDVEWMQFSTNKDCIEPFKPEMGKGYNEYLMIKKAVNTSKTLQQVTHFLKITGRYSMLNIKQMLGEINKRCKDEICFMGDVKDTNIYKIFGSNRISHWGDSRFFVAQVAWYKKEMIDCYKEMYDYEWGKWAEDYIFMISKRLRGGGGLYLPFPTSSAVRWCYGLRRLCRFQSSSRLTVNAHKEQYKIFIENSLPSYMVLN